MRVLLFYLFVPLIVGVGVWRPYWGLAIYLAANIIRPDALFWGSDTGMVLFKLSIAGTLLGFFMGKGRKTEALDVREWWLALWICLAMSVSMLFAEIPPDPFAWTLVGDFYRLQIVCWLIIGTLREKRQILQLIDILLLMAMLLSLWGWQQHFGGNARLEGLGGLGDSNGIAAIGALFPPLAINKIFTADKWWQKLFGLIVTILSVGMIIFTQSRGGFVGLAIGCLYLLLISRKKIWIMIFYILVLLFVVQLLPTGYVSRLNTINDNTENPEQDYSAGSRQVLWHVGWLMFNDHPIFGVGLLNFPKCKAPYRVEMEGKFESGLLNYSFLGYKVGHSTWFAQVLSEGGLFLAIPMFWLIAGFFWRSRGLQWFGRSPTEETRPLYDTLTGLEAGLLGHCASISFIDGLFMPFLTVHIMLGVQIIRIIQNSVPKQTYSHENTPSLPAHSIPARSRRSHSG
ncbi:MAG: O-antigen ligase family protein [Desulfobulbaceae bacterium]|jgi:hypothetical protein|nr:O-antigen ligase family protein [Desulfobulbaceae bacterium]